MTRSVVLLLVAVLGALILLVPLSSSAKVPPACVERKVGPAHIQVGYCP